MDNKDINLFFPVYMNLEKEFLELANTIYIDDTQLDVYSIKIADLLVRTAVEVESIAKELYFQNGGEPKEKDKNLYFDTDCIALLEEKWKLSKKKVIVSSHYLYLKKEENNVLTPLKKANKRGTSTSLWLRAYQAVKHNRSKELKKGNLKSLIQALGGLYILNLYYMNNEINLGNNHDSFSPNLQSNLFSIKAHKNTSININNQYKINEDYDECVYLIKPVNDDINKSIQQLMRDMNTETKERYDSTVMDYIQKELVAFIEQNPKQDIMEIIKKICKKHSSETQMQIFKEKGLEFKYKYDLLTFEAIVNKQQFN